MGSKVRAVDPASARGKDYVSASELSRLAYCERQIAYDAIFGRRTSAAQRQAQERGLRAHEEFYRQGHRIAATGQASRAASRTSTHLCVSVVRVIRALGRALCIAGRLLAALWRLARR
jgi:hypothetical protein